MSLIDYLKGLAQTGSTRAGATSGTPCEELSPCERELRRSLAETAEHVQGAGCARYELLFSGDVQGVGFRWTNQALARERGLTGWAKNLDDGCVRMQLQGPPAALATHLARLHAHYQRFGNRIWLEEARSSAAVDNEGDFAVKL